MENGQQAQPECERDLLATDPAAAAGRRDDTARTADQPRPRSSGSGPAVALNGTQRARSGTLSSSISYEDSLLSSSSGSALTHSTSYIDSSSSGVALCSTSFAPQSRARGWSSASSNLLQVHEQEEPADSNQLQTSSPSTLSRPATAPNYFERQLNQETAELWSNPASPAISPSASASTSTHHLPSTSTSATPASSRTRSKISLLRPTLLRRRSEQLDQGGSSNTSLLSTSAASLPLRPNTPPIAASASRAGSRPRASTVSGSNPSSLGVASAATPGSQYSPTAHASPPLPLQRPQLKQGRRSSKLINLFRPGNSRKNSNTADVSTARDGKGTQRRPLFRSDSSPALSTMPASTSRPLMIESRNAALMPQPAPEDLFDTMLPRELRLRVFQALVEILDEGLSASARAAQQPGAGRRGLLRLASVSRTWQSLALDGTFWSTLDVQSFGCAPLPDSLLRIASHAGSFVKRFRLSGLGSVEDRHLKHITQSLSGQWGVTTLSHLSLTGCRNLTSAALNDLLSRSPTLRHVNLAGLECVTSDTLAALFKASLQLLSLNVSRCSSLQASTLVRPPYRHLSESLLSLNASAIPDMSDEVLSDLPRSFPKLTELRLSHNTGITDQGLIGFAKSITKPSRDHHHVRPLQALEHLDLSSTRITDASFKHLTELLPALLVLEAAYIGPTLDDDGLETFLGTTPLIRKIDLEGNDSLTDRTLRRLCPPPFAKAAPGRCLEHLVLNRCSSFTDEGILHLIRHSPRLKVLEIDNTRARETTVKAFVDRRMSGSEVIAIDCRGFSRTAIPGMMDFVRPRRADARWRYQSQRYLTKSRIGLNEYDEGRTVMKSWSTWSWLDYEAVHGEDSLRQRGGPREGRLGFGRPNCTIS